MRERDWAEQEKKRAQRIPVTKKGFSSILAEKKMAVLKLYLPYGDRVTGVH